MQGHPGLSLAGCSPRLCPQALASTQLTYTVIAFQVQATLSYLQRHKRVTAVHACQQAKHVHDTWRL